jgi:deoxyribonuclease-4
VSQAFARAEEHGARSLQIFTKNARGWSAPALRERSLACVTAECDATMGLERLGCFHLNDCKKLLGCRVDRHEEVGKGAIGRVAFRCLVNDPRFVNTIGVLRLLESLRRRR